MRNVLFPLKGILPTIANPVASFPKLLTTEPPNANVCAYVLACTLKFVISFTIVVSVFDPSEIVLDKGTMVGEGTHDELMENCEIYKEIALSQLTKEELKNA